MKSKIIERGFAECIRDPRGEFGLADYIMGEQYQYELVDKDDSIYYRLYREWPPSLQIIAKDACGTTDTEHIDSYFVPNLETFMHQGVLLLNKALTVGKESHMHMWSWFTEGLITNLNKLEQPIIFYFLGNPAKELSCFVTSEQHYIFESIHPAALAYNPDLNYNGKLQDISKLFRELHGYDLLVELPF